jgi:[protein-PII] uridylyltransferase
VRERLDRTWEARSAAREGRSALFGHRWSERPSPSVATEVSIDDRGSSRHTVIEVITKDRPGLLFTLAQAMHELSLTIHLAKINTEGTRVADVFYVSEVDGTRLAPGERTRQVREALLTALGWRERTSTPPPEDPTGRPSSPPSGVSS